MERFKRGPGVAVKKLKDKKLRGKLRHAERVRAAVPYHSRNEEALCCVNSAVHCTPHLLSARAVSY